MGYFIDDDEPTRANKKDIEIAVENRRRDIVKLLKDGDKLFSREDLAKLFDVHENTIKKDIAWLNDTYGPQLVASIPNKDNSHKRHYVLTDKNFVLPDDESRLTTYERMTLGKIIKLLDGLHSSEWFGLAADTKTMIGNKLNMVRGRTAIVSYDEIPNLAGAKKWLNVLYDIIKDELPARIDYKEFDEQRSIIICSPLLLKEYNKRWFLLANVDSRTPVDSNGKKGRALHNSGVAVLPLDRIESAAPFQDITVKYDRANFNPATFFDDIIGVTHWRDPVSGEENTPMDVIFNVSAVSSKYVMTKPLHKSQKVISSDKDGNTTFSIHVRKNYELLSQLLSFGENLTVTAPQSLVDELKSKISLMLKNYS